MSPHRAAIDCGTNSTRLLVADDAGATVERLMEITRLGQGVDATGALDPAAIDRTIATLRRYREVMDRHGVEQVRITATSAARGVAPSVTPARCCRRHAPSRSAASRNSSAVMRI